MTNESTDKQSIKQGLRRYVADNFLLGVDSGGWTDKDSLVAKGIVDSTGILELVTFVEETFGVSVADEELVPENFDTIDCLTDYIGRKLPPC